MGEGKQNRLDPSAPPAALAFMPPVTRAMVSRPDRSVTWTNVSLNEANWRRGES
jgi:hypothetical protein